LPGRKVALIAKIVPQFGKPGDLSMARLKHD